MSLAAKLRIVCKEGVRLVEEAETELHTENTAYCVIDA